MRIIFEKWDKVYYIHNAISSLENYTSLWIWEWVIKDDYKKPTYYINNTVVHTEYVFETKEEADVVLNEIKLKRISELEDMIKELKW